MEVRSLQELTAAPLGVPTAVALGFFDGIHLGHRALLEATCREAAARGLSPAVVTFYDEGFSPKAGAPRLTDLSQRLDAFRAAGVAYVLLLPFSEVKDLSCDAFVADVLVRLCGARLALCGFNFRFGAGACGTHETLARLMRAAGGDGIALPPQTLPDGTLISSSAVREALLAGDVATAAALLGRPYSLTLPVVHGQALGRTLGLPTANQLPGEGLALPARGVYHTTAICDGGTYGAVTNVGVRPTVGGTELVCESHLLDFSGDLYGSPLTLLFHRRLRGETAFATLDELKSTIESDIREEKNNHVR